MTDQLVVRNNVNVLGRGSQPIMFAHGFGCDQAMWRHVVPHFIDRHRLVLFDLVGSGRSDRAAWSPAKYASLHGHAADVVEILDQFSTGQPTIFVGHSVSAMIGVLAAIARPDLFAALVLVAPSPCYLNDGAYRGGFEVEDIGELLETIDSNYLGWASAMAPVIMANAERPELADELQASFCTNDPVIARHFARVTFTGDNRIDLPLVRVPTLVLQCSDDAIAPEAVGRFTHEAIGGSRFVQLAATGHCPNLSAPAETAAAIQRFLDTAPLAS